MHSHLCYCLIAHFLLQIQFSKRPIAAAAVDSKPKASPLNLITMAEVRNVLIFTSVVLVSIALDCFIFAGSAKRRGGGLPFGLARCFWGELGGGGNAESGCATLVLPAPVDTHPSPLPPHPPPPPTRTVYVKVVELYTAFNLTLA